MPKYNNSRNYYRIALLQFLSLSLSVKESVHSREDVLMHNKMLRRKHPMCKKKNVYGLYCSLLVESVPEVTNSFGSKLIWGSEILK